MDSKYLLCILIIFASGMCCSVVNLVKKHTWIRTDGVISDIKKAGKKSAAVCITYQFNHHQFLSDCIVSKVEIASFVKKVGQKIEITVSPKNPTNIHIISSKSGYVVGIFFIVVSLVIFLLYSHIY